MRSRGPRSSPTGTPSSRVVLRSSTQPELALAPEELPRSRTRCGGMDVFGLSASGEMLRAADLRCAPRPFLAKRGLSGAWLSACSSRPAVDPARFRVGQGVPPWRAHSGSSRSRAGLPGRRTITAVEQQIRFCAAADGVRIAYATHGRGPPLIKAANWLTHLEFDWRSPIWRHWLEGLARGRTVVRYDQRGCGLSDREVDRLSLDAWVEDLEAVVDATGLERFPLLGLSQGGAIAIAYAVRHPDRVSHLCSWGAMRRDGGCGRRPPNGNGQASASRTSPSESRALREKICERG
jgi:alpha/beta hydrolase fold